MFDFALAFEPRIDIALLIVAATLAVLIMGYGLYMRARGAVLRALALLTLLGVLANPVAIEAERERIPDVAAIVVDTSESQDIGERRTETDEAVARLREMLGNIPDLETRVVEIGRGNDGTTAFAALSRALEDVPPDRVAGAIIVTDGEVHDAPDASQLGFEAPVHVLLSGRPGERDRKLTIEQAPRYGIVGEPLEIKLRVDDLGAPEQAGTVRIDVRIDGTPAATFTVPLGQPHTFRIALPHGGENVIEIEAQAGPDELTLINNRAAVVAHGVRDRLRVLLVSGEPHAGERTWRNLLKADPSVDLVHFTILRPPEKQDNTPIDELSLIAFPTRELFVEKLNQFDLIIFDRYKQRGILPTAYYVNMAEFVRGGGAILVASGPDYASYMSIYRSPLGSVMPGRPSGEVLEQPFRPEVTELGQRHPVTRDLPGSNGEGHEATWGRWFRLVDAERTTGETVMQGTDGKPLLILDRVGDGRVALMLSDHAWLWTRGYDGGGPQGELLRRLAHWLMKEPDLEEERLRGAIAAGALTVTRHTMADTAKPVTIVTPSGATREVPLTLSEPGVFAATVPVDELGLYRLSDGTLTAVAASGPLNPREYDDVRATDVVLAPIVEATGGGSLWMSEDGIPDIRRVDVGRAMSGSSWFGLIDRQNFAERSLSREPLVNPWLAFALAIGLWLGAWRQEGR